MLMLTVKQPDGADQPKAVGQSCSSSH